MTTRAKRSRSKARRAPRPKRVTPESLVACQITDYLTAHGIRYKRNQVGVARYGSHFVKYGETGEADYTAFVPAGGRKFWILNIEVKAPDGSQRSGQKMWQALVESMGEYYVVAKSYEPIEKFLKEKGVVK